MKVMVKETKHGLTKNKVYEMDNDNGKVLFRDKLKTKIKLIVLSQRLVNDIKLEEYDAA